MKKLPKITKAEQVLLQTVDRDKHDIYRCEKHGIYAVLKTKENKDCPKCK